MFDLTRAGHVARLTLDRPATRNAIPQSGWYDLAARLADVGDVRVLILDATGAAFCAGADFGDLARLEGDAAAAGDFRLAMRAGMAAVRALAIPVIAAIQGGCFGAGVALAMACDIRIAATGAKFAIPPAKLGITYPHEDVARLVALVGPGQAARLLYGGAAIDAAEAARIGLVEEVAEDAGFAAAHLAQAIAGNAPSSLAGLKAMIAHAGASGDADTEALFDRSFAGADFAEGMAAMREKRPARFA